MNPNPFPLDLLLFFCFIFFFTDHQLALSAKYDYRFLNCSKDNLFNCGRINSIGYPFWGNGRADYCGQPGYYLECRDVNTTEIEIKSVRYQVLSIDQVNQFIRIARKDFMGGPCTSDYTNSPLDFNLFNYSSDTVNLSLFYGCLSSLPTQWINNKFTCETPNGNNAFYILNPPVDLNIPFCRWKITVQIPQTAGERLGSGQSTLDDVLSDGVEVKYLGNISFCVECGNSEGYCGYEWVLQRPTCFCYDIGPHQGMCPTRLPKGNKRAVTIGAAVAGGAVGILLPCIIFFIWQRRKKVRSTSSTLLSQNISSEPSSKLDVENVSMQFLTPIFKYEDLEEATENFHSSKELGDGGFGTVYYGKLRDGREVAVKRLYEHNYKRVEQFMNEINILSRLRHKHLVSLYGCTSRDSRELLLVYEFVPNATVADHLHGQRAKSGLLTWPVRMSIAIESADALAYLHATDIIHRDVKTNNILLDNNFHVKVADFGLSRLFPNDVTHVSTAPQGTPGYVDPEYYQCYQLNDKSDVYSFGVVLIELISSKPAVDISRHRHEINLANMAINKILNHALHELVDPSLGFDSDYTVKRMISLVAELAFRCLQQENEMRPTMKEVLECLKKIENEKYYNIEKGDQELDVPAERGLLKGMLPFSPDSVTDKWASISTTPNTSG